MANRMIIDEARLDPAIVRRACRRLTPTEAAVVLGDTGLRGECDLCGVDLQRLVASLRRPVGQRLTAAGAGLAVPVAEILERLGEARIRFVLIGGLAGCIYGSTHGTEDFDLCHARDTANLEALADLLLGIDAHYRRAPRFGPPVIDASILATEHDFVFTSRLGKIDLIGSFTGVGGYDEAREDAIIVRLGRWSVPVLSLPKMIAAKRSAGRPKDLLVADEMAVVARIMQRLERAR